MQHHTTMKEKIEYLSNVKKNKFEYNSNYLQIEENNIS